MKRRRVWYWLLLLPFIATLFPPFYARTQPVLAGFPFFYWYQLLWVVLAALVVGAVMMLAKERDDL